MSLVPLLPVGPGDDSCHWAYYIRLDGTLVGSSYVQQQNIRSVPSSSCVASILTGYKSRYCSCGADAVLIRHCRLALVHPDALASYPPNASKPKRSRCGLWSEQIRSIRSKPGDTSKVQKGLRPGTASVVSASPRLLHPGDGLRRAQETVQSVPHLVISDPSEGHRFAYSPPTERNASRIRGDHETASRRRTFAGPRTTLSLVSTATASVGGILPIAAPHESQVTAHRSSV
jgi:hypothetical protein